MPKLDLSIAQRKAYRAQAHHLDPVIAVGQGGLTPAIVRETDSALSAHGLIKVRIFSDERPVREGIYESLCDQLGAAPIQHIGKLLILWRPQPERPSKEPDPERKAPPKEYKVLKYSKRGGQRPEVRTVRVLGNERLTATGKVKRADTKQKSIKKSQLG